MPILMDVADDRHRNVYAKAFPFHCLGPTFDRKDIEQLNRRGDLGNYRRKVYCQVSGLCLSLSLERIDLPSQPRLSPSLSADMLMMQEVMRSKGYSQFCCLPPKSPSRILLD